MKELVCIIFGQYCVYIYISQKDLALECSCWYEYELAWCTVLKMLMGKVVISKWLTVCGVAGCDNGTGTALTCILVFLFSLF
jgi:hypothetical protein